MTSFLQVRTEETLYACMVPSAIACLMSMTRCMLEHSAKAWVANLFHKCAKFWHNKLGRPKFCPIKAWRAKNSLFFRPLYKIQFSHIMFAK